MILKVKVKNIFKTHHDVDVVVLSGSALAPDEDGLHLRGQGLLPGDAQLEGEARVCRHAAALAVGVEAGGGVLHLLDQAGHVLEEEVVEVLLLHVAELEHGFVAPAHHGEAVSCVRVGGSCE